MDKKFVMGIAAMAALTLVSCSSDDLDSFSDNSSKNEAISFDSYLGRSAVAVNGSRSIMLNDKEALQNLEAGFGVFGNYSSTEFTEGTTPAAYGKNLFDNQQVTYDKTKSKWTYTHYKYWPAQGHIDFLAYAPYVKTPNFNGSSIDFTVENKVADQKDLLYAKADGQTMTHNSGDNKVKFQFAHALSRLGYSVKLKGTCSSDATITLKKIILAGSATEPTVGSATESGAFYTKGTINLATGIWSSLPTKQYFNWYSAPTSETSEIQSITFKESTSGTTYKNKDNEYLFVIPQDFSGANELYVIVEYTMQYTGVKDSDGKPAIITNTVHKKLTQDFKQGKAYTINLTIGRPIEFDADVTPWTDKTNTNTDIPIDSWE